MTPPVAAKGDGGPRPSFWARLGWGHAGFRVANRLHARLGLCLILLLPLLFDLQAIRGRMVDHNPDLAGYRRVAAAFLADPARPLYDQPEPWYLYAPFFLTLIWPLTKVSPETAGVIFETLKWAALLGCLWTAWRLCAPRGEDVPPIVALGTLVLTWRFVQSDFAHANVNTFLLLAVLYGCRLLTQGRDFTAGAVVAVAACVKITPALVLAYFVFKGRWRTLAGAGLAAIVCLILWPALFIGWDSNLNALGGWLDAIVGPHLAGESINALPGNQSLLQLIDHLLRPASASAPGVAANLVSAPTWVVQSVKLGATAAILGALGWACRGGLRSDTPRLATAAELGLALIVMLLLSGITWKAHYVAMLLPNAALLAYLADRRYPGSRRTVGALLACSFAVVLLSSDLIGPRARIGAEAYGVVALAGVLAAGGLFVVRSRLRRAPIEVQPPEQTPSGG